MAKFCTECGHAITDEMTVCPECGTKLQNGTPPTAPTTEKPEEKKEPEKASVNPDVCPKCGTPYRPGVLFCTECGARRTDTQQANEAKSNPVNPSYTAAATNAPRANGVPSAGVPYTPQQSYAAGEVAPRGGVYGVVSTGAFFWLNVLFNLPGIGWLFCIILSFAPQNVNIKHFARSRLIVLVIALLLAALAWAIFAIWGTQLAVLFSDLLYELLY